MFLCTKSTSGTFTYMFQPFSSSVLFSRAIALILEIFLNAFQPKKGQVFKKSNALCLLANLQDIHTTGSFIGKKIYYALL